MNIKLSVVSFICGCLALIIVGVLGYAHVNYDGATGWLTARAGDVISLLPEGEPSEKGFSAIGRFDIYEDNLRLLLMALSIAFAILALGFAYISAKRERFSLWYSLAVLLAGTALSFLHVGLGFLSMLLTTMFIVSRRNGMSRV